MTNEELIQKFAEQNNLDYEDAAQFIDGFFGVIKMGIANGDPVKIFKLGSFTPKTIKTKLTKKKGSKKVELAPALVTPHFIYSRAQEKKTKQEKKKPPAKKREGENIPSEARPYVKLVEQFYTKIIIIFVGLLMIFSLGLYAGYRYIKHYVTRYLSEQGLTHSAVEEMVNSKFQDVLSRAEEQNQEISSNISAQLAKLKAQQQASYNKLLDMEKQLKKKVTSMIKPQLKKRRKKAQVQMILYTVKKNDTLWGISKKYLKNPYNWVGLYQTNGKKIKNPDKIFPGQKIFIPVIKEY